MGRGGSVVEGGGGVTEQKQEGEGHLAAETYCA